MSGIPLPYHLLLSAGLLVIGVAGLLLHRSALRGMVSLVLIFAATALSFAAFADSRGEALGKAAVVLVAVVVAAEIVVGLGLVIALYRNRQTEDMREIDRLKW